MPENVHTSIYFKKKNPGEHAPAPPPSPGLLFRLGPATPLHV